MAVLEAMERRGFRISHIYGLTETYGPASYCAKHPEWDLLPLGERARLNGRQGIPFVTEEGLSVMDPETLKPVPADGETLGEISGRVRRSVGGRLQQLGGYVAHEEMSQRQDRKRSQPQIEARAARLNEKVHIKAGYVGPPKRRDSHRQREHADHEPPSARHEHLMMKKDGEGIGEPAELQNEHA